MALVLGQLISGMNKLDKLQTGQAFDESKSFWEIITSKGMISALIILGVVLGGYTTVKRNWDW